MSGATKPVLGFIGLGEMGGPMAAHLVKAGYQVHALDLDPVRLDATVAQGALRATDNAAVMHAASVVFLSLPSSETFVAVAERELLPLIKRGQVVIDTGTAVPEETRRLAAAFAARGATLLDVPVSGGGAGARRGSLRMFAGGDRSAFDRCRPVLETIGGAKKLTYCGPSGAGQAVKGVNQLKSALTQAARLEAISLAVLSGVEPGVIHQAFGAGGVGESELLRTLEEIQQGLAAQKGVKFRELPYYLEQARRAGFELPLTRALRTFLEHAEPVVVDDHRPAPSFWHEMLKRANKPPADAR